MKKTGGMLSQTAALVNKYLCKNIFAGQTPETERESSRNLAAIVSRIA
jgi:hypothetical protein